MNITAVVVTRDRPRLLEQTLDALAAQSSPLTSVIVVDNASGDETRRVLARRADVVVHRLEENTGGAGGFATGVNLSLGSNADWIWLLDDDAVPRVDALERLVDVLPRAGAKVGAVCSAVHEFGALALMHRRYFDPSTLREPIIPPSEYDNQLVKIDTGSFVGFLLNAEAAKAVGLPNRHFFLAYDDTEYSLRLGAAGWSIWLAPISAIDHCRTVEGRMRRGPFGPKHYYNLRNQLAVFRRYGHAPSWRLWIPIAKFGALAVRDHRVESVRLWWRAVRDSHMNVL
ncbi:glycosyltransferase [Burkholderia guangdongensis]|uniref:glycosyltransferase n=1 Tax=Burkholderia guangdongensis TaxID=1792500 RepID=UPI0015CA0B08|nr:glycosyltransferase [Burkholderia guangdongensis]